MPKGGKWKKELHACAARSRGAGGAVEALRVGVPGKHHCQQRRGGSGAGGKLVGGGSGSGVFAEAPGERHGLPDGMLLPIGGSSRKLLSTSCHLPLYHLTMGFETP